MKNDVPSAMLIAGCVALNLLPVTVHAGSSTNAGYNQINLVSDISSNAPSTDSRLVNAWGIVAGPGGFWVNDNENGLTTAYSPSGRPSSFAIHIPAPGGGSGKPTGLVVNDSGEFRVTSGMRTARSTFLMATEDGTITAWSHSVTGTNAVIVVDNSGDGAVYKGLTIARDTN